MELPDDILSLVRDFSKPITRPDWRTLHKMTIQQYKDEYYIQYMKRRRYILYSCNNRYEQYNILDATYMRMFTLWHFDYRFSIHKIEYYNYR